MGEGLANISDSVWYWTPLICVFLRSFVLLHLDFSLSYSAYVLGSIKMLFHCKCRVETCLIWAVRQHGEGASVPCSAMQTLFLPYLFLNKHLPREGTRAPEPFPPSLLVQQQPLAHFLLHENPRVIYRMSFQVHWYQQERGQGACLAQSGEEMAGERITPRTFMLLIYLGRAPLGCTQCSFQGQRREDLQEPEAGEWIHWNLRHKWKGLEVT